jgi:uncharacterized protein DUF5916
MNGTINPDFSQVEADAGQFTFDPRNALFFPEKRPFFLDGAELFNTPNNLIYTRRIAAPEAAVKLTGKAAGTDIAILSAMDDRRNISVRARASGVQHRSAPARPAAIVEGRRGVHGPHRRTEFQSRARGRRAQVLSAHAGHRGVRRTQQSPHGT